MEDHENNQGLMERHRIQLTPVKPSRLAVFRKRMSIAFSQDAPLHHILQHCTEAIVQYFDVALARIWLFDKAGKVLELHTSTEQYTHLDGFHSRIPLGDGIIGRVAQEGQPYVSTAEVDDSAICNQDWARREGLVSLVGIPLLVNERVLGVMACFSRTPLSLSVCDTLLAEAHTIALGIDHKQTAAALQKSESYFRSLIENALDILIVLNSDGTIHYASPSFTRELGWTAADLLDRSIFTLIYAEDLPPTLDSFSNTLLQPEHTERAELRLLHKDGSWRWLEAVGKSFRATPQVDGIIVNARDITDRKRMLQELEESRFHMVQAAKLTELGEMATGIAHELNQPLTTIKMGADMLLRDLDASDTFDPVLMRHILEQTSSQVKRITAIINHMRALGHPATGQRSLLNLNTVVLSVLMLVEHRLKSHDVAVQLTLDEGLPFILGEQIPLEQVLIALLNNARDAVEEQSSVRQTHGLPYRKCLEIRTARVAGQVSLSVSDNGPGIPETIRQRIFEPFFTTKEVGKGTGLGLAVSYRIVQQYEGTLTVKNNPNDGATFELRFPVMENDIPYDPPNSQAVTLFNHEIH